MAYDFNGTNQWLSGTPPVTAVPLTMACWFNVDTVTADYTLFGISNSGTNTDGFFLTAFGTLASDPIGASAASSASFSTATTSFPGFSANTWTHACGTFASTTSRFAFINGVAGVEATTSKSPSGINDLSIGRLTRSSPVFYANGRVAECAIWDVVLTQDEISALAKGVEARYVRPASLVFYAPLVRGLGDIVSGQTLTNNNTATVSEHPPIIPRRHAQIFVPKVAGGGATTASGDASSAATATATAAGASIAASDANATASATATGTGASIASAAASSEGAATGTLEGFEVTAGSESGAASSEGTATATGAGGAIVAAAASSAGAATGELVGEGVEAGVETGALDAAGAATATAAGASIAAAAASADGASTARAVGADANQTTATRYDGWLPREVLRQERKRREEADILAAVRAMDREQRKAA